MEDWGKWFQGITGNVVNLAAQHQFVTKPQIEAQRWAALGELGMYREGQPMQQSQGVDPTILLIGAAVVAVLMIKA